MLRNNILGCQGNGASYDYAPFSGGIPAIMTLPPPEGQGEESGGQPTPPNPPPPPPGPHH